MHALIIEDQAIIALSLEDLLRELGYTSVDIAVSSADAIAHASRRCPDLIIADNHLEHGTGVEAVQKICDAHGPIPTIYVVGLIDEVPADPSYSLVLEKPVTPEVLQASVAKLTAAQIRRHVDQAATS